MKIIINHTDPNGPPRVSTVTINDAEAAELASLITERWTFRTDIKWEIAEPPKYIHYKFWDVIIIAAISWIGGILAGIAIVRGIRGHL